MCWSAGSAIFGKAAVWPIFQVSICPAETFIGSSIWEDGCWLLHWWWLYSSIPWVGSTPKTEKGNKSLEDQKTKKIYLYSKFERFWHWIQAVLITILIITGFEIHGTYRLLGFERAVEWHNFVGLTWLVLFVFSVFWLFTTGEWRQYIPTTRKLIDVIHYYVIGIFQGKPHPVQKSVDAKHNPLQRLTYLGLAALLLPVQMVLGLLYYTYNDWGAWGWLADFDLGVVAVVHTVLAFLLLAFFVFHLYMITTGHRITTHLTAMVSGWEEVHETVEIEDWETADKEE